MIIYVGNDRELARRVIEKMRQLRIPNVEVLSPYYTAFSTHRNTRLQAGFWSAITLEILNTETNLRQYGALIDTIAFLNGEFDHLIRPREEIMPAVPTAFCVLKVGNKYIGNRGKTARTMKSAKTFDRGALSGDTLAALGLRVIPVRVVTKTVTKVRRA